MSKKVKPNAEHRVVEGDVVTESIDEKIERGKEFSKKKAAEGEQFDSDIDFEMNVEDDPDSILKDVDPNAVISEGAPKPGFFKRNLNSIMWFLLFSVVIVVLYATRPDTDWQVQKINELQQEVDSLQYQNKTLKEQFQSFTVDNENQINRQIDKVLANQPPSAPVSQEDMDAFKQELAEKITQMESQFSELADKASENLGDMGNVIEKSVTPAVEQIKPEALEKLQNLEESLQQQMTQVSDKLADLFAFKDEQKILSQQPTKLELTAPLNSLQIQQWIVELNTQWLMHGRIQETRKQLLTLEQASSLSDFNYTSQLVRLIGQDLAHLDQLEKSIDKDSMPKSDVLRAKIASLGTNEILPPAEQSAVDADSSTEQKSSFDQLMQGFSKLITVKKRESDEEIMEVNKLLLNDVLKQRLALLVDRLDWGVSSQSKPLVNSAVEDIKVFIQRYYSKESAEFGTLLQPFAEVSFKTKEPLAIMRLDEAVGE